MLKLSIVIPIYNSAKYLERCIESVIAFKSNNIEIILINDGSTDNSERIIEKFQRMDLRIKSIFKENSGCSSSRNLGIEEAKGKYIWFIDSDDSIKRNSIERILQEIDLNPEIIIFGIKKLDIKNNREYELIPKYESKNDFIKKEINLFNSPCNKIYKKKIIKDNNINFLENCHMGEDMLFNFKYFSHIDKIKIIKEVFYQYFLESGVTSTTNKDNEIFLAFDELFKINLKKIDLSVIKKYYKIYAIKNLYIRVILSNLEKNEKNRRLQIIQNNLKERKKLFGTEYRNLQFIWRILSVIKKNILFLKKILFYKKQRLLWK